MRRRRALPVDVVSRSGARPRRPTVRLTAATALGALLLVPGARAAAVDWPPRTDAASRSETTWRGWTAIGAPARQGPLSVAADGTTISLDASPGNRAVGTFAANVLRDLREPWSSGFVAFRGAERVVGQFDPPLTNRPAAAVALPGGRLVLRTGHEIRTSGDLGRHWRTATVPGATGDLLGPRFRDDRHGILVGASTPAYDAESALPSSPRGDAGVWSTDDGGRTWRVVLAPESAGARATAGTRATPRAGDPGPPAPTPRLRVTALQVAGTTTYRAVSIDRVSGADETRETRVERSDDDGASWRTIWSGPPADVTALEVTPTGALLATRNRYTGSKDVLAIDGNGAWSRTLSAPGAVGRLLCAQQGPCVVEVLRAPSTIPSLQVDETGVGADVPALPEEAGSPWPGSIVGVRWPYGEVATLVRSDDGGRSYAADGRPEQLPPPIQGDGVVLVPTPQRWRITTDGERWTTLPAPPRAWPQAVARDGHRLAVLQGDGHVRIRHGARWSRPIDASRVRPSAIAVSGATTLVVGERGLLRISGGRATRELWTTDDGLLGGLDAHGDAVGGLGGVAIRGRLAFAWIESDDGLSTSLVRSADGGRRWRTVRGVEGVGALQIRSARTIIALTGAQLLRSRDGGRRFSPAGGLDYSVIGGEDATPFVRFASGRTGLARARDGDVFITRDGGASFQVLPRPTTGDANVALLTGRGLLTDGPLGTLAHVRDPFVGTTATRIAVDPPRSGRDAKGRRVIRLHGRSRGIPVGEELEVLVSDGRRDEPTYFERTEVRADGRFVAEIRPGTSAVARLRYVGRLDASPRLRPSLSRWVALPRPRGR